MTRLMTTIGACALGLAGCGGSDGIDPSVSFQTRADAAQLIYDQTATMTTTPVANMPDTATASYRGVASALASLPDGDIEALYADVNMTADFGADSISGRLRNWQGNTVGAIGGSLVLSAGSITDNEWAAMAAGTLSADGEAGDVSVAMSGEFLGPDAGALNGTFTGTVDYAGVPTGSITGTVDAIAD